MRRYITTRLIYGFITLFIIATATFFLMKQLPGSPFDMEKIDQLSDQAREQMFEKYGLNDPLIVQYGKYLVNLAKGDLGTSFYYKGRSVSTIISERIGPSALLGFQAILLGITLGITFGIVSALRHNTVWDYFLMIIAILGISIPNFVFAALMQYYFGVKWGLLPVAYWNSYSNSIMPSLALAAGVVAVIARFMRTEMMEVIQQDFMVTAEAKGISGFAIVIKHAIRNALIPVITILGPLTINIITGSLVVESIFAVPGLGSLFVDSIKVNDYSSVMGVTIFYSFLFVSSVLIVDILYGLVDPRIRLSEEKE
ncbi:ABC transporter permease [Brassicibacter mesophilus]|uniref:ABC transporter permease n=1 Tax=Brassicibacter mesophilus TaxID=745119 RepID=UPI003D207005